MFGHDDTQSQPVSDNPIFGSALDDQSSGSAPSLPTDLTTPAVPVIPMTDVDPASTATPSTSAPASNDDLSQIKQQALQQLGPLVGNLEQPPEEKFRTTMMMIQASDDRSLLKAAFDAAQAIPDDKARAQALLDVVNEINYFSQREN